MTVVVQWEGHGGVSSCVIFFLFQEMTSVTTDRSGRQPLVNERSGADRGADRCLQETPPLLQSPTEHCRDPLGTQLIKRELYFDSTVSGLLFTGNKLS